MHAFTKIQLSFHLGPSAYSLWEPTRTRKQIQLRQQQDGARKRILRPANGSSWHISSSRPSNVATVTPGARVLSCGIRKYRAPPEQNTDFLPPSGCGHVSTHSFGLQELHMPTISTHPIIQAWGEVFHVNRDTIATVIHEMRCYLCSSMETGEASVR